MRFEGVAVGVAEGGGEFFGGMGGVVADGLGGEIETAGWGRRVLVGEWLGQRGGGEEGGGEVPDEPEETFGCGVFFCFELVEDEGLEGFGFGGGG